MQISVAIKSNRDHCTKFINIVAYLVFYIMFIITFFFIKMFRSNGSQALCIRGFTKILSKEKSPGSSQLI